MPSRKPSASVIAAGVAAVLLSAFAVFGCAMGLIGTAFISSTEGPGALPASAKSITIVTMLVFMALGVFGVFSGVGLLRLKPWARLSTLTAAGIIVCISACVLLFTIFIPIPDIPDPQPVPVANLKAFLFVFYAIPLGIGIWWLILFNRPGVRAQFSRAVVPDQPRVSLGPRCPLPVAVIGGFQVFAFVLAFAYPLFHIPLPIILFGRRVHDPLGSAIFALTATLLLAAGVGLLKLKRWSYPLVLGVQLFWLASSTITFLGSSYERNMQEVFDEMHLPQPEMVSEAYLHSRSFALAGLLPSVLIVVILLYYRERFLQAADAAKNVNT